MTLGLFLSVLLGFVPMFFMAAFIYWLDRYEKEPRVLLGVVFIWGAVVAVIGALVLQLVLSQGVLVLTGSSAAEEIASSSLFAPVTEEVFKGLAVFLVFLFFRREFDSVLDGIVYAAITALGFAATEDALYYFGAFMNGGMGGLGTLFFLRFIIFGWQHAFFTSFTGIGLAVARLSRGVGVRIFAPILGLALAIFAHSLHNTLLEFVSGLGGLTLAAVVAWSGWMLMFIFIVWLIFREKSWLSEQLKEEVSLGVITLNQYQSACSLFGQTQMRLRAAGSSRYRNTARFCQLCGELSHKKRQLATLGDEGGNTVIIQNLRSELARLSPDL